MIATVVTDRYPISVSSGEGRSEGTHLSGVIYCIAAEFGLLKPEWVEEISLADGRSITDPVAVLRVNIGLAWESHYIPMLPEVIDHPGEMHFEGIYMTPDGESVNVIFTVEGVGEYHRIVHEVKATYKSSNTVGDPPSDRMWLMQIMGYCKGAGTRFAVLHVLFLNGDYSWPMRPVRVVWFLEFTQQEIDDNWSLIQEYKDYREGLEKIA